VGPDHQQRHEFECQVEAGTVFQQLQQVDVKAILFEIVKE